MYVEIVDDKILSWCKNPYSNYKFVDIDYNNFSPEKYAVKDGELIDITQTAEYMTLQLEKENAKKREKLIEQINIFDMKRVRAIAEPSLKDIESGETWLEYYTQQINNLRTQLSIL